MEGSSTRQFPRTQLDQAVELVIDGNTIQIESPENNLSVGGLYVLRANLPAGAPVHVRIASRRPFEADGRICSTEPGQPGVGIGFTSLSTGSREALYELIEDLTLRGLPAA